VAVRVSFEFGNVKRANTSKTVRLVVTAFLAILSAWTATKAGSFLVIDSPQPSDVILVLAGETDRRPARALELLRQGYGRRIVLDVPRASMIYEFTQVELAERYIQDLPQAAVVSVCPIDGLSTKNESKDALRCLAHEGARSVLIVTSDFHTRRALDIFRREIEEDHFSVAAARNDQQFRPKWWQHRQWSKTFMDEWLRLIWWWSVDRWK